MKVIYTILSVAGWAWCAVVFAFLAWRLKCRRVRPADQTSDSP
jgi:hypothetical protein